MQSRQIEIIANFLKSLLGYVYMYLAVYIFPAGQDTIKFTN